MSPDDPRHGTYAGYNQRCRCAPCRAAGASYNRDRRATLRARPLAPDSPQHGREVTYVDCGCRCPLCREAARAAKRYRFDRRVQAAVVKALEAAQTRVAARDRRLLQKGTLP